MSEPFLRPTMDVLGEETLVPTRNVVQPPPNVFTHEVVADTPFYFGTEDEAKQPNGHFKKGTGVVLLVSDERGRCRVVDGQGIYAEVPAESLRERPRE